MFGIGFGEMLLIAVLVLIAVGPDKLPTMLRTAAKSYRQFRRAAEDLRTSTGLDDFLRDEELKELADLRKQKILSMAGPASAAGLVLGKPVGKPLGKPTAPDAPDSSAPTGAAGFPMSAASLTYAQRRMEAPPEGVDVAEAHHRDAQAAMPVPAERPSGGR